MGILYQDIKIPSHSPIAILIVEDHAVVRVGLRMIIEQCSGLEIVGEAGTCKDALGEARRLRPNVILMDLRLPDGSGIEICREILETNPDTKVLFLSSYQDEESMLAAVLAGASGYLLKEVEAERLTQAIKLVAADIPSWIDPRSNGCTRGPVGKLPPPLKKRPAGSLLNNSAF